MDAETSACEGAQNVDFRSNVVASCFRIFRLRGNQKIESDSLANQFSREALAGTARMAVRIHPLRMALGALRGTALARTPRLMDSAVSSGFTLSARSASDIGKVADPF